ncbi:hypothetical protein FCM35_KLT16750 [Carex littledalei]|uniref:Uncharacterized protein n=1 Tax=Carex littledalei TaxID=544730 RepID=A0A833RDF2_9POAL|nr:hypothetical protein FCM35_KLT16750 [Carex littledalei]
MHARPHAQTLDLRFTIVIAWIHARELYNAKAAIHSPIIGNWALNTKPESLVKEFESGLKPGVDNYSRRLVEFCSLKALEPLSCNLSEKINNGEFSRFTYDMMLAWEKPTPLPDKHHTTECIAKESEDKIDSVVPVNENQKDDSDDDDVSLFYSDIMPLLVSEEASVGEDAYVWFGSLFPLASDIVNARFTFETLTAATANRLHYPAYDRFIKEMDKYIDYLQKQAKPTEIELADDEFILHVEGSAQTQKVVRHIGASSWPGRLTLTNKALYFEASGIVSYESALKINLWRTDVDHQVKAASTGPWGAPLFDKAISYQSSEISEPLIIEFPELTGSTRRDLWLALIKEVILLHQFISMYNFSESPVQSSEMHSRAILGVIRLHAAREMLKMSPPPPNSFLIFALYDDVPKGDYVLEELANSLRQTSMITPYGATDVLKRLDLVSHPFESSSQEKVQVLEEEQRNQAESLDSTVGQIKDEAIEVGIAKAAVHEVKDEGIADSLLVLVNLLRPFRIILSWLQRLVSWERPARTSFLLVITLVTIYIEGVGYALSALLAGIAGASILSKKKHIGERDSEVVIDTSSDKSTMESVVEAQQTLKELHKIVTAVNITILKIWSLFTSRSTKHTDKVIWVMTGVALVLAIVPFKYILIGAITSLFVANTSIGKSMSSNPQGARRLHEWWDSIPVIPVRIVDSSS